MRAEDGELGLLAVELCTARLWKREVDCDGVASWVLRRTIRLNKLISLKFMDRRNMTLVGYSEENNVMFLETAIGLCMIRLESLHFKKILTTHNSRHYQPFECVYTAGIGIGGGHDVAKLLHTTT
jgi:hypothetical protein